MDLKESDVLGELVGQHWYYRSKAAAVLRYLRGTKVKRILDVGAGSGFFTKHLLQHSSASVGICIDTAYPCDREEQWFGKSVLFQRSCDAVDADLVLFMDVLEHVDGTVRFHIPDNGTRVSVVVERARRIPRSSASLPYPTA
jgi:2-polyprenyl-3-methyl-5-hydroxy-6-metoxy-1,4-benzoquinol methylase